MSPEQLKKLREVEIKTSLIFSLMNFAEGLVVDIRSNLKNLEVYKFDIKHKIETIYKNTVDFRNELNFTFRKDTNQLLLFGDITEEIEKLISNRLKLHMANNEPYKRAIWWSVEDFASQAEENFEMLTFYEEETTISSVKERAKKILEKCKTWRDYYDETKFEEALDRMINHHDAEYGISWESVRYTLEEMCVRPEFKENFE